MSDKPVRIRREFLWAGQRLADPDPSLSPEQVRDLYSQAYPELTTAAVSGPEITESGRQLYTLKKSEGKRGTVPAVAKGGTTETYEFRKSQGSRG